MNPPSSHTPSNLYETGGHPIENCKRQFRAQLTLIKRKKEAQMMMAAASEDKEVAEKEQKDKDQDKEPDWAAIAVADAAQKFGV